MLRSLRNLFRLIGIARTLARYDALFPAEWLPATGGLVFAARLLSGFGPRAMFAACAPENAWPARFRHWDQAS